MRLLLDENAPKAWVNILSEMEHQAERVVDRGLGGSSDQTVFAHALDEGFTVLTRNKFKRGPDRQDTLTAMTNGLHIICLTVKGLNRQRHALEQYMSEIADAFAADLLLRRVTIMNAFRLKYESEAEIRRKLEGNR